MNKKYLGASIGNCVHVAGPINFLRIASDEGFSTEFLGAAVSIVDLINHILDSKPDVVCIGYRLTPENVLPLLYELEYYINKYNLKRISWLFGGTKPVAKTASKFAFLDRIFDGTEDIDEVIAFVKGIDVRNVNTYADNLIDRINSKKPYPLLRHHFGLPLLKDTLDGVKEIAESKVLDIISIGPDQNAQQFFFQQDKMDHDLDGAGGVPIRTRKDLINIYKNAQVGNKPLLRCYSGTDNVMDFAKLLKSTINNAWCAVPLSWYNVLDGRGTRDVVTSITEGKSLMAWHGNNNIPIEVNESHHWSLRDSHDTIAVVMAYLAAYNAKYEGVKDYIAQYMFNVPPSMHPKMDLAKMLAKVELIESLCDSSFNVFRQVRAGLASLNADLDVAKGQLAASTNLGMYLDPHIIHVVGFSEADHAAKPADVIESCKIVRGVIRNNIYGMGDLSQDSTIKERKEELLNEAKYLLEFIKNEYPGYTDPFVEPKVLADIIKRGIIDAPHLKGNPWAKGTLITRVIDGKCVAYSIDLQRPITEKERIDILREKESSKSNIA